MLSGFNMNRKHRKTLQAIFAKPVNGNIAWRKIEALFLHLGAVRKEGLTHFGALPTLIV